MCEEEPVLTPLADDTTSGTSLFALSAGAIGGGEPRDWLLVLDSRRRQALLFPDALANLRTGASHGPGPFLAASRCGDDCFQPIQWGAGGWQPLGHSIEFDPGSSLHFTYDRAGAPWVVFHRLTSKEGVLAATAYRWDGSSWSRRGRLLVQGVGSPGASLDPRGTSSVLSGTGRFDAVKDPSYWLPALPVPDSSHGGHVTALADGAAVFVTFDSKVYSTTDGSTWRRQRWRPWPNPLGRSDVWSPGVDYSLDRPAGSDEGALRLLWYDDRQPAKPALHLTSWRPLAGWRSEATLDLGTVPAGATDFILHSEARGWLLVGSCRSSSSRLWLEALAVEAGSPTPKPFDIPISRGWDD